MLSKQLIQKKLLIVDDQPSFIYLIQLLLKEIGYTAIYTAEDFDTAWQLFQLHSPDLCILDIDLKDNRTGIDLAEKIRVLDTHTSIIFLTANYTEEYYYQCRHVRPSSFMNKELSRLKLQHAIDLALLNQVTRNDADHNLLAPIVETPYITNKNLFFKIGDHFKKIAIEDICYFFAKDKFTYARVENRNFPTTVQLKTLASELNPTFQRIHKTYLVNVNFIEQIHPKEATITIAGETLPIGYAYRKKFISAVKLLK